MNDIVERVAHRIKTAVYKALIRAVVDTGEIQLVKISGLSGEVQDGIERIQNYGISSNPPLGSESVVACIGGSKDHVVVIATDSGAYRVKALNSGEVVIYSQFGQQILLKSNGSVEITAPAGVSVGNGSDAVAMGTKTDAIVSTISATATGQVCATPGAACPFATALKTALELLPSVASTNLTAD